MSSDLCAVTCYYNPEGYRSKLRNYSIFEERLGVPLVVVECALGGVGFELSDRAGVVCVRGRDVMWQKERLLNVAIQNVPSVFSKIAWLDCDVLFTNPQWAEETSRLLDRYPVVQPFSDVVRLERGELADSGGGERWRGFAAAYHDEPHSLLNGDFARHGHTGFAWAARREVLGERALYDGCVAGSGDHMMAHAFAGDWHGACIQRMFGGNAAHRQHFAQWSKLIYPRVRGAIGYAQGSLLHLWHGDTANRRYVNRNRDLAGFGFDPAVDVKLGASGCWEWSSDKPELHRWAVEYFGSRKEDGEPEEIAC
jgi:hypothetical protein